ncbi:MAG: anion permease, partial [Clostridiales bacterium]|nr:anion permease [Clostridiales bacterium]
CCIIRVEGTPIIDNPERVVKNGNAWSLLFSMGLMMYFAGLLSGEEAGLQPFLQQVVGNVFGNMSGALFLICIVIITTIVTGFFSNMATGIIMMTITVPLASQFGMAPGVLGMIILWPSMFGFLTPGANGATPILFGNEHLNTKTIYKYIPVYAVVFMIMCIAMGLIMNAVL